MGKDEWVRFGWEASDPDTLLLDHKLSVKGFLLPTDELVCVKDFSALTSEGTSDDGFDCFKSTYLDEQGKKRPMFLLTESWFMVFRSPRW